MAALPSLFLLPLEYGKKGLAASLLYVAVGFVMRSRLLVWQCPACLQSFLGDHVESRSLFSRTCCANCGLIQA